MSNGKTLTIADVMTKSVVSADSSLNVNDAAKMMEDAKVGAVIVMENKLLLELLLIEIFQLKSLLMHIL